MLVRTAALAVLVTAVTAQAARADGAPTMPLDQVRAGMQCTAASVLQGTTVTTFAALVDDVIAGSVGAQDARILLTLSGPAVDATGVGPGFSGSPVTCPAADGVPRVIGAISETVGAYGGLTVLATPIQAILDEPVDPPAPGAATGARAASVLRRARAIAEPLSVGGLSPAVGAVWQRAAKRAGRVLTLAPLRPAQLPASSSLQPGSAMAVTLASGDLQSGAIGTVTYVDGDRLWAFGHPLDGVGRRDLFLSTAYVYTVVDNPNATDESSTYKLASPLANIGTLRQDGVSGVAGRIGPLPDAFPLTITARDRDTGRLRALHVQLADEHGIGLPTGVSGLTTVAPAGVAQAIYATFDGSPVRQSVDMCLRVTIRQRPRPLGFCNTYVGAGGDVDALVNGPEVADAGEVGQLMDAYDAGPLTVTKAEVGLRLHRGLRLATITGLRGPRTARRGSTINVRAALRRPGGATLTRTLRVHVPRGMPAGDRDLLVRGTARDAASTDDSGMTIDISDLFEPATTDTGDAAQTPQTLDDLTAAIAAIHRYDGVTARFLEPGEDVPEELPGGAEGVAVRSRRIYRDPALRIAGHARLPIIIRR